MHRIKYIAFISVILLLSACIKRFEPQIDSSEENKYVVSGRITDIEGWQNVEVSLSSAVGDPKYIPVSACQVNILDDKGNTFPLEEYNPGFYRVWIGQEFLVHGNSYKVTVSTPDGEKLESAFDAMPTGPQMDSVYYVLEDVALPNSGLTTRVMQFYVDLDAKGDYSQYYKWEIVETYEYHADRPAEYYYDGTHHKIDPPDYSNKVCYMTGLVQQIYTVSTMSLYQNTYKKFPLHNIDGHTQRLGILYSMLVSQFALSEKAYNYWEQLRINSNEQGGLYEKQPLAIKGNMLNVSHSDRDVLGFFYAASESARRYFYKDVEGIILDFDNKCSKGYLPKFGWKEFGKDDYPLYYYLDHGIVILVSAECVDCRAVGGTKTKPDFWPK
jgi:hypothetical protein